MRLTGFHIPISRLSASSLATFMLCPEQFRLERVLKMRSKQGLSGFVGTVHHGAVERLLASKESWPTVQGGDMADAYKSSWDAAIEEEEPEWEITPDKVAANGLKMLESFVDTVYETINPKFVELEVDETIPGIPVPLVGRIDVAEDERTIELKTAKQKVSVPKAKWVAQQRIYQLFTDLPVDFIVTTRQVTPVTYHPGNMETLRLEVGDPDVTVRSIVMAVEQMSDLYARYGPNETWPLQGLLHEYQCRYCLAGPRNPDPICPAWRNLGSPSA